MKLKNKKTGEIHEITQAVFLSDDMNKKFAIYSQSKGHNYAYRTLAELNAEWQDYEEPKDYWYLNCNGDVIRAVYKSDDLERSLIAIGNYFESPEEAEKAVEKLKVWKRLKDKIIDHVLKYEFDELTEDIHANISFSVESYPNVGNDLDLLFGGEG